MLLFISNGCSCILCSYMHIVLRNAHFRNDANNMVAVRLWRQDEAGGTEATLLAAEAAAAGEGFVRVHGLYLSLRRRRAAEHSANGNRLLASGKWHLNVPQAPLQHPLQRRRKPLAAAPSGGSAAAPQPPQRYTAAAAPRARMTVARRRTLTPQSRRTIQMRRKRRRRPAARRRQPRSQSRRRC